MGGACGPVRRLKLGIHLINGFSKYAVFLLQTGDLIFQKTGVLSHHIFDFQSFHELVLETLQPVLCLIQLSLLLAQKLVL